MPNFIKLQQLVELSRKQGCIEWANNLEREITKLEKVFNVEGARFREVSNVQW